MARPLRITFPGAFYHVTSRGNEQKAVFKNKLSILTKNCTDFTEIKVYHPASPISWQSMAGYPPFAAAVL